MSKPMFVKVTETKSKSRQIDYTKAIWTLKNKSLGWPKEL